MDQERYYRFRFFSFIGYGAAILFIYIVTLGFAFEVCQRRLESRVEAKCSRYDEEIRRSVGFRKEVRKYMRAQERAIVETGRIERGILDRVKKIDRDFRDLDGAIRSSRGRRVDLTRKP